MANVYPFNEMSPNLTIGERMPIRVDNDSNLFELELELKRLERQMDLYTDAQDNAETEQENDQLQDIIHLIAGYVDRVETLIQNRKKRVYKNTNLQGGRINQKGKGPLMSKMSQRPVETPTRQPTPRLDELNQFLEKVDNILELRPNAILVKPDIVDGLLKHMEIINRYETPFLEKAKNHLINILRHFDKKGTLFKEDGVSLGQFFDGFENDERMVDALEFINKNKESIKKPVKRYREYPERLNVTHRDGIPPLDRDITNIIQDYLAPGARRPKPGKYLHTPAAAAPAAAAAPVAAAAAEEPTEGGMIIKQKLKGFEISNDGYGVEIDKLFTQITKRTLVDIMKQLGETENEYALMKKSKLVLTNYFMSKYASKTHTGSKVVADNRRKKKEKYDSPEEKRKAEFTKERNKKLIKERFEASKPRPPPIRRKSVGEKPVSVKPVRPAPVRRPDRFV